MDDQTMVFSPSCWVADMTREEVMDGFVHHTKVAYAQVKNDPAIVRQEDVAYGGGECQKVDVWGQVHDKLLIFVHGGYWAEGSRKDCLMPAKCAMANGFAFASVGYGLAIGGRTLTETVKDVVDGVAFLLQKYPNANQVIVGGHSAGAMLAFHAVSRLRDERIRGLLIFSGCFFLKELVDTEIGKEISLTHEQAKENSCDLKLLDGLNLKIFVVLGLQECPKLITQNFEFAREREEAVLQKYSFGNHYTIMTNLLYSDTEDTKVLSKFLSGF